MSKKNKLTEWEKGCRGTCAICRKDFKHCPHSVVQCDEYTEQNRINRMVKNALKKAKKKE